MVTVEIGRALSDDEDDVVYMEHPPTHRPLAPVKCESDSVVAVAASNGAGGDRRNNDGDDDDGGLKPTTTGGKGLWSLWTRNFKSTLLMLLDLVDNSVDAAMQPPDSGTATSSSSFAGHIEIYRDVYEVMPGQTYTTGLCIRNNSPNRISPMNEILKLFISSKKDAGSDTIGENGVGLKQSCAALSDLSFVLVKNGRDRFELGILAKALQRDDGCYLPCFEFSEGDGRTTVGQQMMDTFCKPKYKEIAACISAYGQIRSGGSLSLARGVARLSRHFEDINAKFRGNSYCFEVVIDKVVYQGASKFSPTKGKNMAVIDILTELQHEIPRRYLHIPDENFKFCVGKKELAFKYWSERMVEFTKIEIPVRSDTPWREDFGEDTDDSYVLRVFLGFDRYRIRDPERGLSSNKACSLYIYSRYSGRLVQYDQDARTMLGLPAGGTDFCQALTVIIDDSDGHLPLDPTKQGVAFGHHANGHVHRQNLYSVINGVVKFYYHYHKNKFDGSKATLTAKISEFSGADLPDELKTCRDSILTEYGVLFNVTKDHRIIVDRTCHVVKNVGVDTVFRLTSLGPPKKKRKVEKSKTPAGDTATKRSPAKKKPTRSKKQPPPTKVTPESKKKRASEEPRKIQLAGRRSSTRTSRRPAYLAAESNDHEDDEDSVTTGNVIDLCSSSDDEDDDSMGMDAPMSPHVPSSACTDQGEGTHVYESVNVQIKPETDDDSNHEKALEIENLNSTLISLQNENKSLKEEVTELKQQLEQSKLALSVIKRRLY